MMNYGFPTPSPYYQAIMSQAVQALMNGGPLTPNWAMMGVPFQPSPQMFPQLMMPHVIPGFDPIAYSQQTPYYSPQPYSTYPQAHALPHPQNYNYPVVSYAANHNQKKSKTKTNPQQPHSNIYDSTSFDSYMRDLSWSRIFDHPSRKDSKQQSQTESQPSNNPEKPPRSNASTSTTTSDETIRRVNVNNKQMANKNSKEQTKGTLPFKYSSEFLPGLGKEQSAKIRSNDVFIVKKS